MISTCIWRAFFNAYFSKNGHSEEMQGLAIEEWRQCVLASASQILKDEWQRSEDEALIFVSNWKQESLHALVL
jgi:hypothetical protein